jgi:uncharacterized protein
VSVTVDANVLLYASDEASPFRDQARLRLDDLTRGPDLVYVFWPVVIAYVRISTHPSVFDSPLALDRAIANVERLLALPHIQVVGEQSRFWRGFRAVALDAQVRGNLVSDAHLVALMKENGVRSIWTHDRDFRRFPGIDVRDPFAS